MRLVTKDVGATRGSALVETALVLPWVLFLFVWILDYGFYTYAAIGLQSASRAAGMVTGSNANLVAATSVACLYARQELAAMPNSSSFDANCISGPVRVIASPVTIGSPGLPATRVSVTYQTVPMIPIPGFMMGRMSLTRTVTVPVYGD